MARPAFRWMLNLPETTIWACVWSADEFMFSRTLRVLRYCQQILKPERFVFLSHLPVDVPGIDYISIPHLSYGSWGTFLLRNVPQHLNGNRAICVHEDGFPVDVNRWEAGFFDYDYIGAPWQDGVVGNSGFFMWSRRFMDLCTQMDLSGINAYTYDAPDMFICRSRRGWLESNGVKFAPASVAVRFSTETTHHDCPSFGFHGRNYCKPKYERGWKLIEESEKS